MKRRWFVGARALVHPDTGKEGAIVERCNGGWKASVFDRHLGIFGTSAQADDAVLGALSSANEYRWRVRYLYLHEGKRRAVVRTEKSFSFSVWDLSRPKLLYRGVGETKGQAKKECEKWFVPLNEEEVARDPAKILQFSSDATVREALELLNRITPGKWIEGTYGPGDTWVRVEIDGRQEPVCQVSHRRGNREEDRKFIASAPGLVKALCDRILQLEGRVRR